MTRRCQIPCSKNLESLDFRIPDSGFPDSRIPDSPNPKKETPILTPSENTKQKRRGIVNSPNWGNANPNKCMLAWIAPPFHFVLKTFCNQNVCKGS